jgi:hypothetical protein
MRLHRPFFDSKSGSDLLVCVPGDKQFQHFLFAIGEHNVTGGKIFPGEELTRSMNIESTRRGAHTEP